MTLTHRDRIRLGRRNSGGFTLLEVLVALSVLAIASTIFISALVGSMTVGQMGRDRSVAAAFAEEQLSHMLAVPEQYAWPNLAALTPGENAAVTLRDAEDEGPAPLMPPSAAPTGARAKKREATYYEGFEWQAYARRPDAAAGHVEVTVVVHWTRQGRPQMLALTTAAARQAVEGVS